MVAWWHIVRHWPTSWSYAIWCHHARVIPIVPVKMVRIKRNFSYHAILFNIFLQCPTSGLSSFSWQEGSNLEICCSRHCSAFDSHLQIRRGFAFCSTSHRPSKFDVLLRHSYSCFCLLLDNRFSLGETCPCSVLFRALRRYLPFLKLDRVHEARPVANRHTLLCL